MSYPTLARLRGVLADDWLFGRFLYGHTEPTFGPDQRRRLAWVDLKEKIGADWIAKRVNELPDQVGPDDEINEVIQTAKELVEADAAQQPKDVEPN